MENIGEMSNRKVHFQQCDAVFEKVTCIEAT
jgi:hypothetical protein